DGVTAIDTSDAAWTVRFVEPEIEPEVAVIDVLPAVSPVPSPPVLIVATPVAEEVHTAVLVKFWVVPSLKVPVAVNCWLLPAAIEGFAGVTAIDSRFAAVPVPVSVIVWGVLVAWSVNVRAPFLVPDCFGEKVTETVQLAPAASVAGQ